MASGNSGGSNNIQSSSSGGGDEEYDSRTESISSFLNKNPPNFASFTSSPVPFPPHHQNLASFYNSHIIPSPQNLDDQYPPSSTPNFQYNNNISDGMIWSAGFRSEANSTDTLRSNQSLQASSQANAARPTSQPEVTKNPKKRTRASRRAPTTVLTTDTTNFRQMVQEFTGIPTAPFPGSPYPRRMNLLSGASAFRPGVNLSGLGPLYSLRPPISQNMVSPFSSSSASSSSPSVFNATTIDAIVSTTNIVTTSNNTSYAATVLGDISSNNPNNSPLLNSDQALLNLQHHNSSLNPSLHGHRFEASGSIDFGNYLGDFRNHQITSAAAAAGDLKINDGNITVWTSGQSVKNDDGIQEKFMPFDGKI